MRELRLLLVKDAQLQLLFLTKAAHELRKAQRQMIVLGQYDPRRRLSSFLMEFLSRNEYYDPDTSIVSLPMSRRHIADYLALTQESVSRALAKMEADGLIRRLTPRIIRLEDLRPERPGRALNAAGCLLLTVAEVGDPDSHPQRAMNPITSALAMSMTKPHTKGTTTNARGAAPYSRVTALMLAIAVAVEPRAMPPNPAHITAAS